MVDSSAEPWSNDPNAPRIAYWLYLMEKLYVAGTFMSAIFYGFTIALFFRCMGALLNPANRTRGGVKWAFVAHAVAMFLCVTANAITNLDGQSISYIDNRAFPGNDELPPGPFTYELLIYSSPISVISFLVYFLGQWLADGLLLYRCWVIYAMSHWVIILPCLMYLATFVMGILFMYYTFRPNRNFYSNTPIVAIGTSYYSISFSLSIILTLMIIVRLIQYSRNFQSAVGSRAGVGGVYKAVVTALIESYAIYVINFIVFMGTWGTNSSFQLVFSSLLGYTQVIAPFLIILRVANRTAITSEFGTSRNFGVGSIHFRNRGESTGDVSLPDESTLISMEVRDETAGYASVRDENAVILVQRGS